VIVGCGRIAGGFNEHSEAQVLTHAAAYRRLGIPLAGCCDQDQARARTFATRWEVSTAGADLSEVLPAEPVVVSVCTPPGAQPQILPVLMAQPSVRAVLLEKPLGTTFADATALAAQAQAWGRPVLVNYFRAFTDFYRELETQVRADRWGAVRRATLHYSGTLESHVSHALERLIAMFGIPDSVVRLGGEDASPLFSATFAEGMRALFVPLAGVKYSVFELDLFCERARLRVTDSERRVELFVARMDPHFVGYSVLEPALLQSAPPTHEMIGAVAATLRAARAGRDESGVLTRAVAVARVLEDAGAGVRLIGS
jgi:predicted dehydrogenase